jgi:hypothetical protein
MKKTMRFKNKTLQITYTDGTCHAFRLTAEELEYLYDEIHRGGSKNGMISIGYQNDFYLINIRNIQCAIFVEQQNLKDQDNAE